MLFASCENPCPPKKPQTNVVATQSRLLTMSMYGIKQCLPIPSFELNDSKSSLSERQANADTIVNRPYYHRHIHLPSIRVIWLFT